MCPKLRDPRYLRQRPQEAKVRFTGSFAAASGALFSRTHCNTYPGALVDAGTVGRGSWAGLLPTPDKTRGSRALLTSIAPELPLLLAWCQAQAHPSFA